MTGDPVVAPPSPSFGDRAATAADPVARPSGGWTDWATLLRPRQWAKNVFVLSPLLFSGRAREPEVIAVSLAAFALFSALASGVYAANDVRDRFADGAHPIKRMRPVAAGRIAAGHAMVVGIVLAVGACVAAWALDPAFGVVATSYLALNVAYTLYLKHVVILDVFSIAAFFVMRLLAGAVVIDVRPSIWLLLCGGLLALFLGFAKRRHELVLLEQGSRDHRPVLTDYNTTFLDQMSVVLLSVTVVAYIMYTLTSETAAAVGTDALSYSTVFVLYGVFRYLYLVHRHSGGNPTDVLFTDRSILFDCVLWLAYCGWVIYRPF